MSAYKPQQRHITLHGRSFHFVSYEGRPANPRRAELPYPPMWYLMVEGRRCPVLPCDEGQSVEEIDDALCAWAKDNAIGPADLTPVPARAKASRRRRTGTA